MGSCRLTLSLMCMAATLLFFTMRLNLSFALVCMVQQSPSTPSALSASAGCNGTACGAGGNETATTATDHDISSNWFDPAYNPPPADADGINSSADADGVNSSADGVTQIHQDISG